MRVWMIVMLFVGAAGGAAVADDGSGAGSAAQATAPVPTTPMSPAAGAIDAVAARKACTDAMNADKTFADAIVQTADKAASERRLAKDLAQHTLAATDIATNERHVVLAYAAMWLVAVGFLMFMWLRQRGLRSEIDRLRRDLEEATK